MDTDLSEREKAIAENGILPLGSRLPHDQIRAIELLASRQTSTNGEISTPLLEAQR
jgi:hypothetical protein